MKPSPFSAGTKILGGAAVLSGLFLLVGWLLPADWEAEASTLVAAPAEHVYAYLDSPEGWREWTVWPDSGVTRSGPERGVGASFSWSHPELGSGSFTLVGATPPRRVEYAVEVHGAGGDPLRTEGVISLAAEEGGVRVTWREQGDLGDNPIMGYWALSMGRAQSEELQKNLDRLATVAAGGGSAR